MKFLSLFALLFFISFSTRNEVLPEIRPIKIEVEVSPEKKEQSILDSLVSQIEKYNINYQSYIDSCHRRESITAGSYKAINKKDRGGPAYGKYQMKSYTIKQFSSVSIEDFMENPEQQEIAMAKLTLYICNFLNKHKIPITDHTLHFSHTRGIGKAKSTFKHGNIHIKK